MVDLELKEWGMDRLPYPAWHGLSNANEMRDAKASAGRQGW